MKKIISVLLAAMMLLSTFAGLTITAQAETPQNGWYKETYDGSVYWWYYENGSPVSGWKYIKNAWYYFEEEYSSMMISDGVYEINGKDYYFASSGAMQTGWIKQTWSYGDVEWYYAKSSGELYSGWVSIKGKWYYFDEEYHYMYQYQQTINGKEYAFDKNGAMITGWGQDKYGEWYFAKSSGELYSGWVRVKGVWYYLDPDDYFMYIGSWNIDGKIYFFNSSGAWVKSPKDGWNSATSTYNNSDGSSYKYTEWAYYKNGKALTGWVRVKGTWYYMNKEHGNMVTGVINDNGKLYFAESNGALRTKAGWVQETYSGGAKGNWYYLNSDGTCVTGWLKGKTYYLDPDEGYMYFDGIYTIDGVDYEFDASGACLGEAEA